MKSITEQRVATYKRMLEAFNANNLSLVRELVDDSLIYTIPGRSPIAGRTIGIPDHITTLRLARDLTNGTLHLKPRATAVDGAYLLVWGRLCAERAGRHLDCDHCVMYRFEGERVVEGRTVPTNLYEFDAFWGAAEPT